MQDGWFRAAAPLRIRQAGRIVDHSQERLGRCSRGRTCHYRNLYLMPPRGNTFNPGIIWLSRPHKRKERATPSRHGPVAIESRAVWRGNPSSLLRWFDDEKPVEDFLRFVDRISLVTSAKISAAFTLSGRSDLPTEAAARTLISIVINYLSLSLFLSAVPPESMHCDQKVESTKSHGTV